MNLRELSHVIENCRQRCEILILLAHAGDNRISAIEAYAEQYNRIADGNSAFIEIDLGTHLNFGHHLPSEIRVGIAKDIDGKMQLRIPPNLYPAESDQRHKESGILVLTNVPRSNDILPAVAAFIKARGCPGARIKKNWLVAVTITDPNILLYFTSMPGNILERTTAFSIRAP